VASTFLRTSWSKPKVHMKTQANVNGTKGKIVKVNRKYEKS